jgi:hypothetical protein
MVLLAPARAHAALLTVGSPLEVPATLNTSEGLDYTGINTEVPRSPQAPNGVVHTAHFGADTAIWNARSEGLAAMPDGGEAVKISLEGCAVAAPGGPPPLTQIHFQDLSPLPGGGEKVNITSGGFEIPVCGQSGASASTVSVYKPFNLCVSKGDYVDFNDEGGFVEGSYRAGVPYQVLGAAAGATVDSYIRNDGTGNGAIFSTEAQALEGFAASPEEELMMQVQLGTGPDARYACPGGSKEAPPVLPVMRISPQTDGINRARIVEIAAYCRPAAGCQGSATLTLANNGTAAAAVGRTSFTLAGDNTTHIPIRVAPRVLALIRKHDGVATTISAIVNGQTFTQTVKIKIL